jgi:hypothetical protein
VPADLQNGTVVIETAEPAEDLYRLIEWARQRNVALSALTVGRPSLEDAYLQLTRDGARSSAPDRSTR